MEIEHQLRGTRHWILNFQGFFIGLRYSLAGPIFIIKGILLARQGLNLPSGMRVFRGILVTLRVFG